MTELGTAEKSALEHIKTLNSINGLRQMRENAKGKSEAVRQAALERLIDVSASAYNDPVARDCWRMIFTVRRFAETRDARSGG